MKDNKNGNVVCVKDGELEYIQFKNLVKYSNDITHCFTTRLGGVSTGECSSMNLGFNRKDTRENVEENYRIISNALGIDCNNMVFSNQVHDNRIRIVTEEDRGKGITRKSDIIGFDGLVTNRSEVVLVTFYADCVPVFFYDPDKKVAAISHSGWRGTVKNIANETIKVMMNTYGCSPESIEASIGPSIGKCCFETGEEVYTEFINRFKWSSEYCARTSEDKWHISLQEIIRKELVDSGVRPENVCLSGICTKCNKDVFFSHRGDNGRTGSLAAIMQINK